MAGGRFTPPSHSLPHVAVEARRDRHRQPCARNFHKPFRVQHQQDGRSLHRIQRHHHHAAVVFTLPVGVGHEKRLAQHASGHCKTRHVAAVKVKLAYRPGHHVLLDSDHVRVSIRLARVPRRDGREFSEHVDDRAADRAGRRGAPAGRRHVWQGVANERQVLQRSLGLCLLQIRRDDVFHFRHDAQIDHDVVPLLKRVDAMSEREEAVREGFDNAAMFARHNHELDVLVVRNLDGIPQTHEQNEVEEVDTGGNQHRHDVVVGEARLMRVVSVFAERRQNVSAAVLVGAEHMVLDFSRKIVPHHVEVIAGTLVRHAVGQASKAAELWVQLLEPKLSKRLQRLRVDDLRDGVVGAGAQAHARNVLHGRDVVGVRQVDLRVERRDAPLLHLLPHGILRLGDGQRPVRRGRRLLDLVDEARAVEARAKRDAAAPSTRRHPCGAPQSAPAPRGSTRAGGGTPGCRR
ncbi:beta-carotene 15,15'-monooxygenase [Gracilaria domingensis]|nr:beta-carotene 15,15'-monooxygenase [Gracilaria domingensis]